MANDLLALWSEIDGITGNEPDRFRQLYYDRRFDRFAYYAAGRSNRRRPGPFESAIETCRRLRDLNALRRNLTTASLHAVLGGSMSYGRFLNISGSKSDHGSDTDLLLVLGDYSSLPSLVSALRKVGGANHADLESMQARSVIHMSIRLSLKQPCSFSHKITFWDEEPDPWMNPYDVPGHYRLSVHVFSLTDFEFLILKDTPVLDGQDDGFQRILFDYRPDRPDHRLDHQRSFGGTSLFLDRPFDKAQLGFLSQSRACVIRNGRYYPGMFQNLILPQFEIRWEDQLSPLHVQLSGFRWKIVERLRKERQLRPYELLRLSLSHTRSFIFAPHIARSVDGL